MIIKEVIVVEGNHDLAKLKLVDSNFDIVTTNGASVNEKTLELLKHLNETRGLILMLDPDAPGDKIRRTINEYVGDTKHIFLAKKLCVDNDKKKVGIEHAKVADLKEALMRYVVELKDYQVRLTMKDLVALKLTGIVQAKMRREIVSNHFHLGQCNAKTLLKRVNMLNITKAQLSEVLQ